MSDTTSEPTTGTVLEAMRSTMERENREAGFGGTTLMRKGLRAALTEAGFGADGGYTLDALARLLKAAGIEP